MWRLVPVLVREMGQAYPELHPRRGADHRDAQARGDALPQARSSAASRSSTRRASRSRRATCSTASPRSRSTTPTAFRSISRRTRCKPRGIGVDIAVLHRRHGAPAREGARLVGRLGRGGRRGGVVRAARKARRHRIPRLRDRERRRAWSRRWCATARKSTALKQGRERRRRAQPDAVLRRVRRPGRRHRRDDAATACALRVTDTQKTRRRSVRALRHRRAGHAQGRRPRSICKSITRGAAPSGKIIRRRICCTRRCARCSAITWRRRARWSRPIGCASISRIPSR